MFRYIFLVLFSFILFPYSASAEGSNSYHITSTNLQPIQDTLTSDSLDISHITLEAGDVFESPLFSVEFFSSLYFLTDLSHHHDIHISLVTKDNTVFPLSFEEHAHGSTDETIGIEPFYTELETHYQIRIQNNSDHLLDIDHFEIVSIATKKKKQALNAYSLSDQTPLVESASFILSRSAWGADENLRTVEGWTAEHNKYCTKYPTSRSCRESDPKVIESVQKKRADMQEKYGDELKTKQIIDTENGYPLYWPLKYAQDIKRIFVHHTAQRTLPDEAEMIRSDYYFHTIVQGWGDIGYNFLIGPSGNIYQGRAGDPSTVGAHTVWHNHGSIGIALLGNFHENEPGSAIIDALSELTSYVANKYNFDLNKQTSFRGIIDYPILGHRDVNATACPGDYLHPYVETLRNVSGNSKHIHQEELSENQLLKIKYGVKYLSPKKITAKWWEDTNFKIKLQNNSSFTWKQEESFLRLNPDSYNLFHFPDEDQTSHIALPENVSQWKSVEVDIELEKLYKTGVATLAFDLIINQRKIEKAVIITTQMKAKKLEYQVVKTSYPEVDYYQRNNNYSINIAIKNTSDFTWGKDLIRMIPGNKGSHSQDWNYGYMQESEVAPNEIGNFVINLDIQSDPGKNKEYYNLEYAKNTQFHDEFHFFDYTVASEEFIGKFISQTSYPDLFYGESYLFETRWRNDGQTPWTKDQLFLVNKSHGFQMHMLEDIVHPWETATFQYLYHAPYTAGEFLYEFHFQYFREVLERPFIHWRTYIQQTEYSFEFFPEHNIQYNKDHDILYLPLKIKNTGQSTLPTVSALINREGLQPWKKRLFFDVKPGQEGIFYLKLHVGDEGRFFDKNMYFDLFVYDQKLNTDPIIVHVDRPNKEKETTANITSTIDTSAPTNNRTLQPEAITDRIRVKLGFESDTIQISPSKTALLSPQKGRTEEIAKTHTFTIKNGHIFDGENDLGTFVRLQGHDVDTIWSIENWDHSPGWNPNLNDNMYRDTLELKIEDGKIIIINELPLHHYLNGIAEVSNTDPTEKLRTMMILSRSYALFYMTQAEKFPGKPYHLDDSPERCQNYKGYGLELRAPNMVTSNADTAGMVVTYDGDLIKTPYFNQSDGWTRSAEEVWGWTHTPYLQRVDDSICGKTQRLGHGVGLSGCGATNMAIQGDGFEKIIQYYYQGVEIDNASDL